MKLHAIQGTYRLKEICDSEKGWERWGFHSSLVFILGRSQNLQSWRVSYSINNQVPSNSLFIKIKRRALVCMYCMKAYKIHTCINSYVLNKWINPFKWNYYYFLISLLYENHWLEKLSQLPQLIIILSSCWLVKET